MKNLKTVFASITLILFISASILPITLNAEECTPSNTPYYKQKNKWFGGCKDKPSDTCIIKNKCPRDIHIHIKL